MDNVICYLVSISDKKMRKKIAEMLRIHQIQITDDINQATVIVHIPTEAPQMTIEKIALSLVAQTQAQVFKLQKHFDMHDITVVSPKDTNTHKKLVSTNTLKKYNNTKQKHKKIFFNRTKCK